MIGFDIVVRYTEPITRPYVVNNIGGYEKSHLLQTKNLPSKLTTL